VPDTSLDTAGMNENLGNRQNAQRATEPKNRAITEIINVQMERHSNENIAYAQMIKSGF
jgi:hypothetical protein